MRPFKSPDRLRVAVMFGGLSVEHEISVITGLQLMEAMDSLRYDAVPVYIAPNGRWYCGNALLDKSFYSKLSTSLNGLKFSSELCEVTLLPKPGVGGLTVLGRSFWQRSSTIEVDVYMPVFHGRHGEDGALQGLLELCAVPYTGSSVAASSLSMDKDSVKTFLRHYGIESLPHESFYKGELSSCGIDGICERIASSDGLSSFPLIVKPSRLGSSIGISTAQDEASLRMALMQAFSYDSKVIVEPYLSDISEINISVLPDGRASVCEMPIAGNEILSYTDKYLGEAKKAPGGCAASKASGMATLSRVIDPEEISADVKARVRDWALLAYSAIAAAGVVRFDFILDNPRSELYFNEVNSLPGSLAYYLWEKTEPRLLYTELIDILIRDAQRSYAQKASLDCAINFKALYRG